MKRFLCTFVSIMMLLTSLPMAAFAGTEVSTYQALWTAVYANESYITLTSDISYEIKDEGNTPPQPYKYLFNISGTDNITIDLNGHKLAVINKSKTWPKVSSLFCAEGESSFTIINGDVQLTNYNNDAHTNGGIFVASGDAYMTITNVNATTKREGTTVSAKDNATVNIEGGTIMAYSGFAVSTSSNANLYLDKNVHLTTYDGSGVPTQFNNTAQGSLHCESPNITIVSATFEAGVEVCDSAISAFAPSSSRYVFVNGKEYKNAFSKTKIGDYYWYSVTGGMALIKNSGNIEFAKNLQVIRKNSYQMVSVENGSANPNRATYGTTVSLTADNLPGRTFTSWLVLSGGVTLNDYYSKETTFVMGADPVIIEAVYDNGYIPINTVEFAVETPKNGAHPNPTATSLVDGLTVSGDVYWVNIKSVDSPGTQVTTNDTFEAGKTYRAIVNFDIAFKHFINSDTITFVDPKTKVATTAQQGATNKIAVADYTIPPLPEVSVLNAAVSGMNAGSTVSSVKATTSDNRYLVSLYGVYSGTSPFARGDELSKSEKLTGGRTYVVGVKFTASNDYALAKANDVTINGESGLIGAYDGSSRVYYVSITASEQADGWAKNSDGKWMYYENGIAVTGWKYVKSLWYYMDENGIMQTGWVKVGKYWYYLNSSGAMQTGWVKVGNYWYYLNSSGAMLTGWVSVGGKWYYMNSSGAMQTGWVKVGNYWYYMSSSGAMMTGWVRVSGYWYYLESNGRMRTANLTYKGKVYRFRSSGVCLNP